MSVAVTDLFSSVLGRCGASGEALAGRVRWWRIDIDAAREPDTAMLAHLAPLECVELRRYQRREDRARFAAVRSTLRLLLSGECGLAPSTVPIRRDRFGRPCLAEDGAGIDFNVSHAGKYGLIALSRVGRVGVDVELERDFDVAELAELVCSADERSLLASLAEADRSSAFLRLWVQKEAALKAVGVGIASDAMPLISPLAGRLHGCADLPFSCEHIELAALPMPAGYDAAIALSGAP
ncbi:4'-phosphopantetheinyl transferase superfamily protein [Jeongeupia wiesaeckerbachi]|uniref:4'-phosphopantetheinyl transferase family protein n=1 Tax=Jeongeupia wiesaeckerbachi TaxID=3051218 RepID=UPI003D808BE6